MTETRLNARPFISYECAAAAVVAMARSIDAAGIIITFIFEHFVLFFAWTKLHQMRPNHDNRAAAAAVTEKKWNLNSLSCVCGCARAIIKTNAVLVLMIDVPLSPKWMIYVNVFLNVWFDGWQAGRQADWLAGWQAQSPVQVWELVRATCGCNEMSL